MQACCQKIVMSPSGPADQQVASSRGVYGISVAAELVGSSPQNLRLYESRGLLSPARSDGGTRRYSNDDLHRLRQIGQLLEDGLNLAGIATVLALQAVNHALQAELDDARQALTDQPAPKKKRHRGQQPDRNHREPQPGGRRVANEPASTDVDSTAGGSPGR
jgi:MerR family transcriptional regulator, heat shock protein HspR